MRNLAWMAISFVVITACTNGRSGNQCVNGMSVACACPGGRAGAQVCTNGGFEACVCDGDSDGGVILSDAPVAPGSDASRADTGAASSDAARSDGASTDATTNPLDGSLTPTIDAAVHSDTGGTPGECSEGATRCGPTNVERCTSGLWRADTTCALSCSMGACTDERAMCTPGAVRCYRSAVQRCNRDGSSWLYDSTCSSGCTDGLCTGACVADTARCNGSVREVCATSGTSWSAGATCTMGCEDRVCVEPSLELPGTVVDVSGTHVYAGCVALTLAAELRVPAGRELVIRARCLTLAMSSRITLGAGSSLRIHVTESATLDGTVTGGRTVFIESKGTLRLSGTVSSERTTLRADDFTIATGGRIVGSSASFALYGSRFSNMGTHTGVVSVMPPSPIQSPTHPSGTWWSMTGDDVVVTWDRPFASVRGYYVLVGDQVPGPSTGVFRTTESISIPMNAFAAGNNTVRIVSVNADSAVGTHTEDLYLKLNLRSPRVTSTSHPNPLAWGGADDVFLSWADPTSVPATDFAGYLYVWDRYADTVPTRDNATFDDRRMLLLSDQAPGIWYFHIVVLDRLGRPSPLATHYAVRVGAEPQYGNVAGTITAADTHSPIPDASVVLSGGILRTRATASGDYSFRGLVPAAAHAYRVTVSAPGYRTSSTDVVVAAASAIVLHFDLTPMTGPVGSRMALGPEVQISDRSGNSPAIAVASNGSVIFSRVASSGGQERVEMVTASGDPIAEASTIPEYYPYPRTDVGWTGASFFAVDTYACGYEADFGPGSGWSCLSMRTWDVAGRSTATERRFRNSGQTGSPSAVWNGTTYGVFFTSYATVYFRELNADLAFTNGRPGTEHTTISSGHADSRQSATTRALWDGTNYALAWSIGRSASDNAHFAFFARVSRAGALVGTKLELSDTRTSAEIGLAFDGSRYYVLFVDANTTRDAIALRSITSSGVGGLRTDVSLDTDARPTDASLAFDGTNLLVAYQQSGRTTVQVRNPADHALLESHTVDGLTPRLSFDASSGRGAILYVRGGITYMKSLTSR